MRLIVVIVMIIFVGYILFMPIGSAEEVKYEISSMACDVRVHTNGSITLKYWIEIQYIDGSDESINGYDIGMPREEYIINFCHDEYGNEITYIPSYSDTCPCGITVYPFIIEGSSGVIVLEAFVPEMVYLDPSDSNRVAIDFIPSWWNSAQVNELTLTMTIPCSVLSEVMVSTAKGYNSPSNKTVSNSNTLISWSKTDLSKGEKYMVKVYFPKSCVTHYADTKPVNPNLNFSYVDSDENVILFPCVSYLCYFVSTAVMLTVIFAYILLQIKYGKSWRGWNHVSSFLRRQR